MPPPSAGAAMLRPQVARSMAAGYKGASMACALQKCVSPVHSQFLAPDPLEGLELAGREIPLQHCGRRISESGRGIKARRD